MFKYLNIRDIFQAEEAREHCKNCITDVGVKRVDLANTKSEILTQIRELVFQCDLTLKAVSNDAHTLADAQTRIITGQSHKSGTPGLLAAHLFHLTK